ncbi:sigma-54 interaction domain-containing protein [Marinicellulosiphila megalodicopiae]|uniref:sigma-54 interaction domain-containing protein n=1 Tax=Marinicellulosiphila megalodicopiae TaxID=2724896 RepID=UPI003BAE45A0
MKKNPKLVPENYSGLLTVSTQMKQFVHKVERVAKTNASILVRGNTGTGKDLIARHIHNISLRSNQSYKAINCATLTGELMTSELFGHVKGAYTGAISDRKGLLQLTDKGTLFLDEIAEMPLDIQARLLRVLQDKEFSPVGSSQTLKTDIRLISATHESLRALVAQKKFREDLMYRIRVIPLFLPSLVERTGDVEMLLWHFIEKLNNENPRKVIAFDEDSYEVLMNYEWPGNVRELQNTCEYMHAIGEGSTVTIDDLPQDLFELEFEENDEKMKLAKLMQKFNGKRSDVALEMGCSRATLWRKLKQHQLT